MKKSSHPTELFKNPKLGKSYSVFSKIYYSLVTVILLMLLAGVLSVGYLIWNSYSNQIMCNQKEQLLLTSRTLADNIELSLEEFRSSLHFLCLQQRKLGSFQEAKRFYQEYLWSKNGLETDILLYEKGTFQSVENLDLEKPLLVSQVAEDEQVYLTSDLNGRHLFLFSKQLQEGSLLCLAVDADHCYEQWLSGVSIGTSGYIMVKNSSGIILMHPEQSQWGIHVIEGRRKRYPDLDLTSLENMVAAQNRGEEGVSEYYSYWWLEQPLERVLKISGYAPVTLGEDFWVISSVVDYHDFSAPIDKGFSSISLLFIASLGAAVILLLFVSRLVIVQQRSEEEIRTLRDLNERLETIHRGEERIGHQQRLQVIGTLTGGIAHEFNNLLTPIMGYSEMLMMDLPEDSEGYDDALEIFYASEKAREVVRQISTLSRKNVETIFKRQEACALLQRICKMMHSICPAGIHLEEDFSLAEGTSILCNSTQISQVMLNLCVNAVHAIQEKARAESGEADPTDGLIRFLAQVISREKLQKVLEKKGQEVPEEWEQYLCIQLEDNGCGMSEDVLRQIFTPFFTTKKAGEGTGLGLALAEQIVLSHRGYIYASSSPQRGSVFTVCLPVMETKESPEGGFLSPAQPIHVVIADDNAKILDLLRRGLLKYELDIDIDICRTREELKKVLEHQKVDVLLIDENLEDASGTDFCMAIHGTYPSMVKIVMADYPTHLLLEARQRSIINGYLLKPFSDADALEEIRRCIVLFEKGKEEV